MRVLLDQVLSVMVLIIMSGQAKGSLPQVPVLMSSSISYLEMADYGNSVTSICRVTSVQFLKKVYWQKLFNDGNRHINSGTAGISGITFSNLSMTILTATIYDSGTYQCAAENSFGTGYSSSIDITVKGGLPIISISSESYTTVYGQPITLSCAINANPVATSVYWLKVTKGNTTVINNGAVGTMGITPATPSLTIPYPNYEDSGEYTCYATNAIGTSNSGVTVLTVTGEIPKVTVGLRNYDTDYGNSIVLSCTVAATTILFYVYWEKDASGYVTRITSSTTGITGVTKDNPSLTITFATTSDTGIYTCFAANYIGTGSSKPTTLTVNGDLPKVSAPRDSYHANEGETVSLECLVTAQPPVKNVYWVKKKDAQLTVINQGGVGVLGVSASTPTLTIQYTVTEDSGMYTCYATNVVGSSSSSFIFLTVTNSDGSSKDGFLYAAPLLSVIYWMLN